MNDIINQLNIYSMRKTSYVKVALMGAMSVAVAGSCLSAYSQSNSIEVPISIRSGSGPFHAGMGGIAPDSEDENNPWRKTYLKVYGIPADWTDAKKGDIHTNIYQSVYQHYLQGNVSQQWYEQLQQLWNWKPDKTNLSKKPLRCQIAFAYGKDVTGTVKMVVDANNNLDFSDDVIFTPLELTTWGDGSVNLDSLKAKHSIAVRYERLSDNQIIEEETSLFIAYHPPRNMWMSDFPQHAVAEFGGNEFAIQSFTIDYIKSSIVQLNDSLKNGKKATEDDLVAENEYLVVNDKVYTYKGVNRNKGVMLLERVKEPQSRLYSSNKGFKAIPFEGADFKTKAKVSLESCRGKYVLIDFWAVWCGPCLQEMPALKALYESTDRAKIEVIGVVGDSPTEGLGKMIEQYAITWPQVLSDESNAITKKYGVRGYPTTLLLDPEGIIIAKNLRGKALEAKITELMAD
ncbi:hypothetical protein FACS1894195_1780 [Bacteroidia bacterium]|nr:hypothetical protein FACS1894195_1780 [Bacteroidia bacterium]